MPGSGTSWRAEDLREWDTARVVVVRGLNTFERTAREILDELREAERKAEQDKFARAQMQKELDELKAVLATFREKEFSPVRHTANNALQAVNGLKDAEAREEAAEKRAWRKAVLERLATFGGGAGTLYGLLQAFGG